MEPNETWMEKFDQKQRDMIDVARLIYKDHPKAPVVGRNMIDIIAIMADMLWEMEQQNEALEEQLRGFYKDMTDI